MQVTINGWRELKPLDIVSTWCVTSFTARLAQRDALYSVLCYDDEGRAHVDLAAVTPRAPAAAIVKRLHALGYGSMGDYTHMRKLTYPCKLDDEIEQLTEQQRPGIALPNLQKGRGVGPLLRWLKTRWGSFQPTEVRVERQQRCTIAGKRFTLTMTIEAVVGDTPKNAPPFVGRVTVVSDARLTVAASRKVFASGAYGRIARVLKERFELEGEWTADPQRWARIGRFRNAMWNEASARRGLRHAEALCAGLSRKRSLEGVLQT